MTSVPNLPLSTGAGTIPIPQLGFGVWQVPDAEAEPAVTTALETGYRSIDTARLYGNEAGVGRAIKATDIPREELFVTTKVWNDDQGFDSTLAAFDASMGRLGLDTLDLVRLHPTLEAVGLDFSAPAVASAAGLASELGLGKQMNVAVNPANPTREVAIDWDASPV